MTSPELARLVKYGPAKSEDEGRAYSYPLEKVDGKYPQYPSVTTVLKMVDKSSLVQWAVNLSVDWAVNNLDALHQKSIEQGIAMGRYRWKDIRDERASVGDGIHATIEAKHTGTWDFPELNDEQLQIMEHWRQLNTEHAIEPIHSELTMFNRTVGYAGTADGIWMIDGQKCLIDIKTSKSHWPEHDMQLSALLHAEEWLPKVGEGKWESMAPEPTERVAIIHLRSDLHELIYIDDDILDASWDAFQGYKMAWDADRKLKDIKKAKYSGF